MKPDPRARRLTRLLRLGGTVATGAGLHTLVAGAASFPPWRRAEATLESELRFYSAFYVAFGLLALHTGARADPDPQAVRGLAATLLLGGLGRAGAWLTAGRPHPLQQGLLALELAVPVALLRHTRELRASHRP